MTCQTPSAPVRRGVYTFPEQIWGFKLTESRAYVGANFFGMGILDISNPASPTLIGTFKSPGQVKIGALFETTVALIDHMEGVVFVDLSDGNGAFADRGRSFWKAMRATS